MRKYLRFVSQSVLGMLGLSVYILADTFFIANYIGADGLASLNLALPIYGIINGTGLLIGIGGGVRYTLRHTRGDENADSVFTASLLMGAVLSFIYVLCGVFGAEHLARLLGASGTVLQPTTVYLKVCCLFSPFFIISILLQIKHIIISCQLLFLTFVLINSISQKITNTTAFTITTLAPVGVSMV